MNLKVKHLYLRIWLAVVLGVAVLMALVGWAWHVSFEHNMTNNLPQREWIVRNAQGEVLASTTARPAPGQPLELSMQMPGQPPMQLFLERRMERPGGGSVHLGGRPPHPRDLSPWWARPPYGFVGLLALMGVAAALALYPVVRRLTKRLEGLQQGVQRWGEGDLSARVPEAGDDEVADLSRRFNAAAQRIEHLMALMESTELMG